MIVDLESKDHPKAEVLLIDFKHGQVDFCWLEADGTPSKIYSGDCVASIDLHGATSLEDAEAAIKSALQKEAVFPASFL